MIRLYLDSDVINNFHSGKYKELLDTIKIYRADILILYSPAHISDKLPSLENYEDKFWQDLDYISEISECKMMAFNHKKKVTMPYIMNARKVYDIIKETKDIVNEFSNIDSLFEFIEEEFNDTPDLILALTNLKELLNEPYEINGNDDNSIISFGDQFQKNIDAVLKIKTNATAYKLQINKFQNEIKLPSHVGESKDDVIGKIDDFLVSKDHDKFIEMVENSLGYEKDKSYFNFYTKAYMMLNLLGYKSDKVDVIRNKGFDNHLQDATHSFYGAHCDYFVAIDNKLKAKSKALFDKLNIQTKIIHPDNLKKELERELQNKTLAEIINSVKVKEQIGFLNECGVDKTLYKLDNLFLGYFNLFQLEVPQEDSYIEILLRRSTLNYSEFFFYEEHNSLITHFLNSFGPEDEVDKVLEKFKNSTEECCFIEYVFNIVGSVKLSRVKNEFYLWITSPI
jgi:hypothetical protein